MDERGVSRLLFGHSLEDADRDLLAAHGPEQADGVLDEEFGRGQQVLALLIHGRIPQFLKLQSRTGQRQRQTASLARLVRRASRACAVAGWREASRDMEKARRGVSWALASMPVRQLSEMTTREPDLAQEADCRT